MAKILVAEDEHPIRNLIIRNLQLVGHDCIGAEDGAEALRLIEAKQFDLMIFDDGADLFLLTGRQLVPERQIFRKFHGLRLLSNRDSIRSADGYVKWKSPGNQTAAPRRKLLLIDQKIK